MALLWIHGFQHIWYIWIQGNYFSYWYSNYSILIQSDSSGWLFRPFSKIQAIFFIAISIRHVGLELTSLRSRVACSIDWASQASHGLSRFWQPPCFLVWQESLGSTCTFPGPDLESVPSPKSLNVFGGKWRLKSTLWALRVLLAIGLQNYTCEQKTKNRIGFLNFPSLALRYIPLGTDNETTAFSSFLDQFFVWFVWYTQYCLFHLLLIFTSYLKI